MCVCACVRACVHVCVHSYSVRLTISLSANLHFLLCSYICAHLHLLSLQNGLTALEVARASTDKDWDEEDRRKRYKVVHDYDGVVDLLSEYTAELAVLPSHPVSGTITTSSH